jgi:hypothetical protein
MCACHSGCSNGGCGCQSQGCSCACHKACCGCQQKSCGCGCGCQCKEACSCKKCGCNFAGRFLELADQAWMELLKEKIKENIRSKAKNLDELARLISEANHERWQKKMEDKQCIGCYEEKLKGFFDQACRVGQKSSTQSSTKRH